MLTSKNLSNSCYRRLVSEDCVRINAAILNIRKKPNAYASRLGAYKLDDIICPIENKNGWLRSDKGWISAKHTSSAQKKYGTQKEINTKMHNCYMDSQ